jgi:S-(hydroxymethyl)glutathione dehydrogenase/alcohol dehydrogenase
MKTTAAVLWEVGTPWSVEDVELDPPRAGEVLVELRAAGLCHTDDHYVTGDMAWELPMIGGHEGAGVVLEVGPDVRRFAVGHRVILNYMPICGSCPSCARGRSRLCDRGAAMGTGLQISDATSRHHARGQDLRLLCCIGTFARHTVAHEDSCIPVDDDIPFEVACLMSCGVVTGWGSSVRAGGVEPGDTVAVVGVGGLGAGAVQGARLAGARNIVAIDPVPFKREKATEFGATHTAASMAEAFELVDRVTAGRMCNAVVMTMGVGDGTLIADAMALTAKFGSVVVTNAHPEHETSINISLADLTIMEKRLIGSVFGGANARADIPMLLDLYRAGELDLDGLVTRTYPLEDVNLGYADLHAGRNIRGVLVM